MHTYLVVNLPFWISRTDLLDLPSQSQHILGVTRLLETE